MVQHLDFLLHQIPTEAKPMFRYWFPPDTALDLDAIRRDMETICASGFGGVELKCEGTRNDVVELGTARWQAAMTAAMEVCAAHGCRADMGNTAGQFIDSPAIASLDDPRAAQELDYSSITIPANHRGPFRGAVSIPEQMPPMKGPNVQTRATLVCVTAGSLLSEGVLDEDSLREVSDECTVRDGVAFWNVPDQRPWVLFFHWKRARNEVQATRLANGEIAGLPLLDFYNREASQTFIRHWLETVMTPRMRELAGQMHSCLFSDNVENSWSRLQWSDSQEIFARFFELHGYALAPYLPLLYRDGGGFIPESAPHFTARDQGLGNKVHEDYCETMTALYIDNYLRPVREALQEAGMRLRCQTPYGSLRQEQTLPACYADVPETESLWMGDSVDGYWAASGAAHMSGKHIYSSEVGAVMGQANRQTWMDVIHQVERSVMGGVNLAVLHGYGYGGQTPGSVWPGWSCMAPEFSNDWGPRSPQWRHAPLVAAYLGRMQAISQWGQPQVDLAIMRLAYKTPRCPAPTMENEMFDSSCLRAAGFTYEYVSPGLLRQFPEGFHYKALLVSAGQMAKKAVQEAARALADRGVMVLVYGTAAKQSPGIGSVEASEDAAAWLLQQGIIPSAAYQDAMPALYSVARTDGTETAYLLYNDGDAPLCGSVTFAGGQHGRVVDLWSGTETARFGILRQNTLTLQLPGKTLCAVLFDGKSQQPQAEYAIQTLVPTDWTLTLEKWLPGEQANISCRERVEAVMEVPTAWSALPGLECAAGIGRYETSFVLPAGKPNGAQLILEQVCDTFEVMVNGTAVQESSQSDKTANIGPYLLPGKNTLCITVVSPLFNQLTASFPTQYGSMPSFGGEPVVIPKLTCGLTGVKIQLYSESTDTK
jgi:hypothetical protein